MLHDMRFTAAQLRAAGEWCEPKLADVELVLDCGVLVVEQGEEQAMFAPDGSDAPACRWCGRAEATHVEGQQPEPHDFDALAAGWNDVDGEDGAWVRKRAAYLVAWQDKTPAEAFAQARREQAEAI